MEYLGKGSKRNPTGEGPPMTNQIMMLAAELLMMIVLTMLSARAQRHTLDPQYLGSVGWHGGKKKR